MDSLKREARWSQGLDFVWHKEIRFRISTCVVEYAKNLLLAHVWAISWSTDSCGMSHLPWQGNEDSEFQHAARLQCTIFRHREVEVCPWSATIPSVYFASTNLDIRSTRDETEHTLIWLTNGPSLKATQPSVSLAQGQCFAYCCRKSWK